MKKSDIIPSIYVRLKVAFAVLFGVYKHFVIINLNEEALGKLTRIIEGESNKERFDVDYAHYGLTDLLAKEACDTLVQNLKNKTAIKYLYTNEAGKKVTLAEAVKEVTDKF